MKRILRVIALGAALAGSAWAQSTDSTNTPPPGGPPGEHHPPDLSKILTPDELKELNAAHDAAMQANPDLEAQEQDLVEKRQKARDSGQPPDPELVAQMMQLHQKIHAAMLKIDPKLKPILAKIDAIGKQPQGNGPGGSGGPPPPPQQQGKQGQPPPPPPTHSAPSGN